MTAIDYPWVPPRVRAPRVIAVAWLVIASQNPRVRPYRDPRVRPYR
jgi:hypothetical protein